MDLLSNMLSSIKNACMAKKPFVEVIHSNECEAVAKVLKDKKFLSNVKVFKEKDSVFKRMHLDITYENGLPLITDVTRVSKPGGRVYKSSVDLKLVHGGRGVSVVSTSRGVMPAEEAKKKKLGGEVICKVQ
jgi:small subunit ribosomal protein S8